MKVNLKFAPGTVIDIELADGTILKDKNVKRVSLDPFFTRSTEVVNLIRAESVSASQAKIDSCNLTVSGQSGKMQRTQTVESRKKVVPAIDKRSTSRTTAASS